jgi:hypothetical protein
MKPHTEIEPGVTFIERTKVQFEGANGTASWAWANVYVISQEDGTTRRTIDLPKSRYDKAESKCQEPIEVRVTDSKGTSYHPFVYCVPNNDMFTIEIVNS